MEKEKVKRGETEPRRVTESDTARETSDGCLGREEEKAAAASVQPYIRLPILLLVHSGQSLGKSAFMFLLPLNSETLCNSPQRILFKKCNKSFTKKKKKELPCPIRHL